MSAALDLTRPRRLNHPQQDVGQPARAPTPSGSRWFVVRTHPQAERWACQNLQQQGWQTFLPMMTVRRRDRVIRSLRHTIEVPLFAGYAFLHCDPISPWTTIRSTFGVATVLGYPKPEPLRAGVLEALQALEPLAATEPPWKPGSPCSLSYGPLNGMPGVVLKVGHNMALVSLLMLGQLREVSVSLDCLSARDD